MNTEVAIQVGSRVFVDFISDSRTEFSGNQFSGEGVVDQFDDLYVMGRLDTGLSFMCGYADLTVTELAPLKLSEDEKTLSVDEVATAIADLNVYELDVVAEALTYRNFSFEEYCSCDPDADAEDGRRLALINLIERINLVGLHDALEELRRDGFMLGAHIDCKKLES